MADPNFRCQVANRKVAAPPPIPDGNYISDIATDMADVIISTAAELAPRSKRPRGAQARCAGPGGEAEMNRRRPREEPHNRNLRKAVKVAGNTLRKVREAAVVSLF